MVTKAKADALLDHYQQQHAERGAREDELKAHARAYMKAGKQIHRNDKPEKSEERRYESVV